MTEMIELQTQKYLVSFNNKESGPFTLAEIKEKIPGEITREHWVCAEGTSSWQSIISIIDESVFLAPELHILAENKSVEILQKINATAGRIAESKQEADLAKAMKTGWFGKTGKKADATANALVAANAAISEMNNLLQESIRFTCSSIQFAQVMHKTMAYMMVNGFKDTNGQVTKLSKTSQESVQFILDEADDFVRKQLAVEESQAEIYRRFEEKDKIDDERNQRFEHLKNIFENEREKTNKAFLAVEESQAEMYRRFEEKNKIDDEQNQRLDQLKNIFEDERVKTNNTFDEKNKIDREQSERLENLQRLLAEVARKKTSLLISIIALVISAGTLIFSIVRFYLQ